MTHEHNHLLINRPTHPLLFPPQRGCLEFGAQAPHRLRRRCQGVGVDAITKHDLRSPLVVACRFCPCSIDQKEVHLFAQILQYRIRERHSGRCLLTVVLVRVSPQLCASLDDEQRCFLETLRVSDAMHGCTQKRAHSASLSNHLSRINRGGIRSLSDRSST